MFYPGILKNVSLDLTFQGHRRSPLTLTIHLYINTGELSLLHVPSTFATVNTYANMFFVFLPGGISKEWRHIVSANCEFEGGNLADSTNVNGPFGEHLGE